MGWEAIAAIWLGSGAIGSALIAVWWTDELPLTTDELPGVILSALLGPFNLGIGLMFMATLALKKITVRLMPKGRRVILNQWGRE
jgi:hypothetical protein